MKKKQRKEEVYRTPEEWSQIQKRMTEEIMRDFRYRWYGYPSADPEEVAEDMVNRLLEEDK